MVVIRFDELSEAFDFVGSAPEGENEAYISLETGRIYWISELSPPDVDIPDDLETSEKYLVVPHRADLELGKNLALRFAGERLPEYYGQVEALFRRRGAYRRFKDLLESKEVLEQWYAYENEATERALKEWCSENGIELIDRD